MLTILIALTTTSHATTFAVPLDYPSLVDAVVASNADTTQPNEIVIASGTYSFVGGLGVTHDVTIKPDGSGPVVFQRGYGNAAFFLPDATSLTIEDIDFTAYNARIVDANPGSVVTVTGCAIGVGETSDQGGALRVQGGELIVTDSTFTGPIANSQDGGAIYASNSIVTINDSTFTDLTARRGGAVYTTNSGLTINRAHFEGTSATQSGGAVYVLGEHPSIDTGDASISGASFCDTSADKGGALWVGSNLSVTNSVFARTSAITAGHAIQGDDNVLLDHNTMVSDLTAGFLVDLTADVGTISAYDNAVATSGAGAFANNSTTEERYNLLETAGFDAIALGGIVQAVDVTDLSGDPMLANWDATAACADLQLWPVFGSPLVDAANPTGDVDPDGSAPDIGAYGGPGSFGPEPHVDDDLDGFSASRECDDTVDTTYPGAAETCDHVDSNCDGVADDDLLIDLYTDADEDGFGAGASFPGCDGVDVGQLVDGDCDDTDPDIYPGATEVVNDGIDQDCDGSDEKLTGGDTDTDTDTDSDTDTDTDTDTDGETTDTATKGSATDGCECATGGSPMGWLMLAPVLALVARRR